MLFDAKAIEALMDALHRFDITDVFIPPYPLCACYHSPCAGKTG
jgi:hypothetical protein